MEETSFDDRVTEPGSNRITLPAVFAIVVNDMGSLSRHEPTELISTRLDWLAQRVETLERTDNDSIKGPEYEAAKEDLANRLEEG